MKITKYQKNRKNIKIQYIKLNHKNENIDKSGDI